MPIYSCCFANQSEKLRLGSDNMAIHRPSNHRWSKPEVVIEMVTKLAIYGLHQSTKLQSESKNWSWLAIPRLPNSWTAIASEPTYQRLGQHSAPLANHQATGVKLELKTLYGTIGHIYMVLCSSHQLEVHRGTKRGHRGHMETWEYRWERERERLPQ